MIMETRTKCKHLFNVPWIWICAFGFCPVPSAYSQLVRDDQCSHPNTHRYHVESIRRESRPEVPREEAIQTLACIATRDQSKPSVGSDAVRTLFALARDDAEARSLMLQVALDQSVSLSVHSTSCKLLTLVADNEAIRAVRDRLMTTWPGGCCMGYYNLLREHGDSGFLEWLDARIAEAEPGSPFREFLERDAARVRVQRTPEQILPQMEFGSCSFDCSWYVLQAFRHGVEDDVVRQTLMRVLRRPLDDTAELGRLLGLLADCYLHGILSPEEVQEIPELQKLARIVDDPHEARRNDWVAERIAAKRTQFFRSKRLNPQEE